MKKNANIQTKGFYTCKVTNKEVTIQILASSPKGGWEAVNTETGKKIHIKSPDRLIKKVAAPKAKPAKSAEKEPPKKQPKANKEVKAVEKADDKKLPKAEKKLSLVGAAIEVLQKAKEPMGCKEIVEQVLEQKLWQPAKGGKTPANTLYASFLREIKNKGKDARFKKSVPGKFELNK